MNKAGVSKIDELDYIMQEIKELALHYKGLADDNYLLVSDFKEIKPSTDVRKIKLYSNYFNKS